MSVSTFYNQAETPAWVAGAKELFLDIETTGLDPWSDRIALITITAESGETAVVRCHSGVIPPWLADKLNEPGVLITGHNLIGFDALFLDQAGIDTTKWKIYDTMVGELVTLTSGRRDVRVSLSATVKRRTGTQLNKEIDHTSWDTDTLTPEQLAYVGGDVAQLRSLKIEQLAKVAGTPRAGAMDFEQRLVPITVGMTLRGMPLDLDAHSWLLGSARGAIAELTPGIEDKLGQINFRSSVQVKRALHSMGIMVPNTKKETMQMVANDLEEDDPEGVSQFARDFISLRQNLHRSTMWDEEWVDKYLKSDQCIHARYWQMGTDTIRYSSGDPNYQQIARTWRGMCGGVEGHKVVSIDYAALEVRVAACIFGDEALAEAIMSADVHSTVFARSMGMRVEDVSREQRRLGKAINFLCLFGGGPKGYYEYCSLYGSKLTELDCRDIVFGFWRMYQGVKKARDRACAMADSKRPVTLTLPMGHQRTLFGDKLGPTVILNTSVQGTAATGIKAAILELDRQGLAKYLRMQVHDELVFLTPDELATEVSERAQEIMKSEMEKILPPLVPIGVEAKIGANWS